MSKEKSGLESPLEFERSWCVEGHVKFGVISSILMQRNLRTTRQSMSPDLQRALENYKEDGQSANAYNLKMTGYLDTLERLGYVVPKELGAETPAMLATWEGKIQKGKKKPQREKGNDKRKNKLTYAPKPKILLPPKRDNLAKDSVYHYCKEGLRESKKLKHGALSLNVGNEMRAAVKAIKSFDLVLPSGLIVIFVRIKKLILKIRSPRVVIVSS
uniref:Zinc finger, CCHC-type n=1 Tax=Tanacetum cinerariifolium TaxID=118510 RepID=A0A6L2M237_TANCI|nr:hypothetical protein [Tanacetum cinerariifolium]